MFETSLDAWYAWAGVALVSVACFGIVVGFPTTAPPTASAVADSVDRVVTSPNEPRTTVDVPAEEVRIDPHRVGLRTASGTVWQTFQYGPVTPVDDGQLARLLDGATPEATFESKAAFAAAVAGTTEPGVWRPAPEHLVVRRVTWGEISATLVGE
ncbi:MAG: hypothetical protein V5A55_04505 [Halovenus sp.]